MFKGKYVLKRLPRADASGGAAAPRWWGEEAILAHRHTTPLYYPYPPIPTPPKYDFFFVFILKS